MNHLLRCIILLLLPQFVWAQIVVPSSRPQGYFLTDSIEIGRPFQYSLTYRHPASRDVLFPDTARQFAPYRVEKVAVFTTRTTGSGPGAISQDSAVYTLVSFETDSVQRLQVPVRLINDADCTAQWTQTDSVFLRSKLPLAVIDSTHSQVPLLATETDLVPLQQQFNYVALAEGFLTVGLLCFMVYGLFGRIFRRQWKLYQLKRQHLRFLNEFNRLTRTINSYTAAETANQAVILWKNYLEQLDSLPYTSMTTPELSEKMADVRVKEALREADRVIYSGSFSPQSQPALRLLGEVATQMYHQCRDKLLNKHTIPSASQTPTKTSSIT